MASLKAVKLEEPAAAGIRSVSHSEGLRRFSRQVEHAKMCHERYDHYQHLATGCSPRKVDSSLEDDSMLEESNLADLLDPSLAEGHSVVYNRECPLELRVEEIDVAGSLEPIRCKVLLLGERECPENCRIELSSERDIFFHYIHNVDAEAFRILQDQQKLNIEFSEYVTMLIKMLNTCITEPHLHLAIFLMQRAGCARLDFVRNLGLKFVELLTCDFSAGTEELVRQHINHRYNSMKSKTISAQARLDRLVSMVYIKNPALRFPIEKMLKKTDIARLQCSPKKALSAVSPGSPGSRGAGSYAESPFDNSRSLDAR